MVFCGDEVTNRAIYLAIKGQSYLRSQAYRHRQLKWYTMTVLNTTRASTKTVVILGAAYAGRRCAQVLGSTLPPDWRVVVIDRNTHFNRESCPYRFQRTGSIRCAEGIDVYVFPRFTVLSSHANKAFVPYTHAFQPRPGDTLSPAGLPTPPTTPTEEGESLTQKLRVWIHGNVSSLSSHSVTYTRLSSDDPDRPVGGVGSVEFDYMIYALGASLPSPVDVWGSEASGLSIHGVPMGCKRRGVEYMERRAETMKRAKSVLVVGGGALGIRESRPQTLRPLVVADDQNWRRT